MYASNKIIFLIFINSKNLLTIIIRTLQYFKHENIFIKSDDDRCSTSKVNKDSIIFNTEKTLVS